MNIVPLRVEIVNPEVVKNHNPYSMACVLQCYSPNFAPDIIKKMTIDDCNNAVRSIAKYHEGVLEHGFVTVAIEGIARDQSHQEVRHRHSSYLQQSQRHVDASNLGYVENPDIAASPEASKRLKKHAKVCEAAYADMFQIFKDLGMKDEEARDNARAVLFNAAETKIVITRNYRDWKHFFSLRCCNRAQVAIRVSAYEILRQLRELSPLFDDMGAYCDVKGYCPEGPGFSCGRRPRLDEVLKDYNAYNADKHGGFV